MENRILKLVLLGFGNVGQAFAKLLQSKKRELADIYGIEVLITGIATAAEGSLLANDGIDIQKALLDISTKGVFENAQVLSAFEAIEKSEADAVIELSPLSITDGQPAIDHVVYALSKGRHVITANKGPVAWAFAQLSALAAEQNRMFLFEATVMNGTPVFNMVKYTLPNCKILSFEGILNVTSNFILAEVEKGSSFDEAVREAQRRGFADADPSMDIKGMDANAKTCALVNALMGANITPAEVSTQGIENITPNDIASARQNGETIKLLCRGYFDDSGARGVVKPERIPLSHPFATVNGAASALSINTDLMGRITIFQHDSEIKQTAYGIYSDMLTLKRIHN